MARKKVYKDGEMEEEFNRFKFYHKYVTIQSMLIKHYPTIYLFDPFKKYANVEGDCDEKAVKICDILVQQHDNGDDTEVDKLYWKCWEMISPTLRDNENFTEGFKATD